MNPMNINHTVSACIFGLAASSLAVADIGVVEATGAFLQAGAASTSYISAIGSSQNPRLDSFAFADVNRDLGQSLILQNWFFENYAYNGGGTPAGAASNNNWLDGNNVASLLVTVKSGSTTLSSNSYSLTQTGNSGNNRFWQLQPGSKNLSAGLANGAYSVEFSVGFNFNVWNGSFSQGTSQTAVSTATFNVIPAPGAIALLGVAGIVGARRRR